MTVFKNAVDTKRVISAIARIMLACLYHMFSKQEAFNPADTDYSAIPEDTYEKYLKYDAGIVWFA